MGRRVIKRKTARNYRPMETNFKLTDNHFIQSGVCYYRDEFGNEIRITRQPDGFAVKPIFANKIVTAPGIFVKYPIPEGEKGVHLKMNYSDFVNLEAPDILSMQKGLIALIDRWINLMSDIALLDINDRVIMEKNPGSTLEDAQHFKITRLSVYEEMQDFLGKLKL